MARPTLYALRYMLTLGNRDLRLLTHGPFGRWLAVTFGFWPVIRVRAGPVRDWNFVARHPRVVFSHLRPLPAPPVSDRVVIISHEVVSCRPENYFPSNLSLGSHYGEHAQIVLNSLSRIPQRPCRHACDAEITAGFTRKCLRRNSKAKR